MPTAETLEWKKEAVRSLEWTSTTDDPLSWGEVCAERFSNQQLEAEIEQAKLILNLGDDWDGEGSASYSEATLERAIAFLNMHMERLWKSYGIPSPIPSIGPGPDGSIDVHWKQPTWELLVNIPGDANEMAAFYGDNYGTQKIKGSLNPECFNLGIAEWLAN